MRKQYDNNMRGVLFKNERASGDNDPTHKGQCEIDGVEYWMNGWMKKGKNGPFMSISFTEKEQRKPQPKRDKRDPSGSFDDPDDDFNW